MKIVVLMVLHVFGSSLVFCGTPSITDITQLVKRSQVEDLAENRHAKSEYSLLLDHDPSSSRSTTGTKRRRKKCKAKQKCKCLADFPSCGYKNESSETTRKATDVVADKASKRKKTYIEIDCFTLCQSYTCRVHKLNPSQMEPRHDEIHSPNISTKTLVANDGTVQSRVKGQIYIIIGIISVLLVVMFGISCISFYIRRRKIRSIYSSRSTILGCMVPADPGLNHVERNELSITESLLDNIPMKNLRPEMCKKYEFKRDVTNTVVSGKQTEDYFEAKQKPSHWKGLEEVGTDDVKQFNDLMMNKKSKSSKYDYEANKLTALKEKETEAIKSHCSDGHLTSTNYPTLPEHKSKGIEVDLLDSERNETAYQQKEGDCGNDVKVSIVKPLAAPADEKREGKVCG